MFRVSAEFMMGDNDRMESLFDMEDHITQVMGFSDKDSGAGFGFRDVTFYVPTEDDAWKVLEYMREFDPASDSINPYTED